MTNTLKKPKNFHIATKAVIVNKGKALVLKDTGRYPGFDLPGGKIDEGESLENALKRELFEELGLEEFKLGRLLQVYERQDYKKENTSLMLVFFEVFADISEIKLSSEHDQYRWIAKEDLDLLSKAGEIRNEGVKKALAIVLK